MTYENAQQNNAVRIVHLEGYPNEALLLEDSISQSKRWNRRYTYFSREIDGVPIKQDIAGALGSQNSEADNVDLLIVGLRDLEHIGRLVYYMNEERPPSQYVVALMSNHTCIGTARESGACHKELLKSSDFSTIAGEIAEGYDAWLLQLAELQTP